MIVKMVDTQSRNNWLILVVIAAAVIVISVAMTTFIAMLNDIGNNINTVVNNTSKNMTLLTEVLIADQRSGAIGLNKVVDNQTRAFVKSVGNFTDVIINYSGQNDRNLNNISSILTDIRSNTNDRLPIQ